MGLVAGTPGRPSTHGGFYAWPGLRLKEALVASALSEQNLKSV